MNSFETKLEKIIPLDNIQNIKSGKEWIRISFQIKEIVGNENYKKARFDKDNLKIHLLEMLDERKLLTFDQTARVIEKYFSKVYSKDKLEYVSAGDLEINYDSEEFYKLRGEPVEICWHPSVVSEKKQALLKYDEYDRLIKSLKDDSSSQRVVNSTVNFDFQEVVKKAVEKRASDIHILYGEKFYHISFKINGKLEEQKDYKMNVEAGREFVKNIKILASEFTKGEFQADVHMVSQDAIVKMPNISNGMGVDVRLVFIPCGRMNDIAMTARILQKVDLSSDGLIQSGYDESFVSQIQLVTKRQNGIMITSGITGSGKSTLNSNVIANEIDESKRVYTVEDPVEYFIPNPNVTQHQIFIPKDQNKKMGFNEYVKSLKRADPDVLVIGEMRKDPELIEAIFEMAEAGQLVFTTVHITSAFSIYGSMEQVFNVSPYISVPVILFSINQVLVDRLCPYCKEEDVDMLNRVRIEKIQNNLPYKYTNSLTSLMEDVKNKNITLYKKGKGCQKCENKGYLGRIPIYEYFMPNVEFIEWLLKDGVLPSRFAIEEKACEMKIGENKLDIFCKRLKDGTIDASERTLNKIL